MSPHQCTVRSDPQAGHVSRVARVTVVIAGYYGLSLHMAEKKVTPVTQIDLRKSYIHYIHARIHTYIHTYVYTYISSHCVVFMVKRLANACKMIYAKTTHRYLKVLEAIRSLKAWGTSLITMYMCISVGIGNLTRDSCFTRPR